MKRSIVYVDGFNLYYGAIRGTANKWLDLQRYFKLLRPNDDIQAIRYFSALITGSHGQNQKTYLAALDTLPLVEVILGKFKNKQIECTVSSCQHTGSRRFTVPEEKRTDVNIALYMLDDAYQDLSDRFILVSGDSDLVPAIHQIKKNFPKKEVIVYVPARNAIRGAAVELRSASDKDRLLPLRLLEASQFRTSIPNGTGGFLSKPSSW